VIRPAAALLLACGLAACAGAKLYPNDAEKNLVVQSRIDAGTRASLHVSGVGAGCAAEYQGRLALDQPSISVGLPAGRLSYLEVAFEKSSLLGGARSMSAGTLFRPREGYRYELTVSYRDSIYAFTLRELEPGGKPGREIPRREIGRCAES
jgi:hypothetical protein